MDRIGHKLPSFALGVAMNAGCAHITDAARLDLRGFAHDQAGRGALRVVLGIKGVRCKAAGQGAAAGQGRHDDAIGALKGTDTDRIEEAGGRSGVRGHPRF